MRKVTFLKGSVELHHLWKYNNPSYDKNEGSILKLTFHPCYGIYMVVTAFMCAVADGFPLAASLAKGAELIILLTHLDSKLCDGFTVNMVVNTDFRDCVIEGQTASETSKKNLKNDNVGKGDLPMADIFGHL